MNSKRPSCWKCTLIMTGVIPCGRVAAGIVVLRFSQLTRRGLEYQDQLVFNRGWKNLKLTFMIFAITSCVSLVVVIFSVIGNWETS
jgi:hypothetical protein